MRKEKLFAGTASIFLLLGLIGCAAEDANPTDEGHSNGSETGSSEVSEADETPTESGSEESKHKSEAEPIDRASSPWNSDFPADFPLEDIPFPPSGSFDYAELVEEDVWNVMLSDISQEDHDAWMSEMAERFNEQSGTDMYYMGYAPSGIFYSVMAMYFDKTDDGLSIAYRISIV